MMIRSAGATAETGFCLPRVRALGEGLRIVLIAELITTVALALSTLAVAAVAVVAHAS